MPADDDDVISDAGVDAAPAEDSDNDDDILGFDV